MWPTQLEISKLEMSKNKEKGDKWSIGEGKQKLRGKRGRLIEISILILAMQ